jgi:hypothetical protein
MWKPFCTKRCRLIKTKICSIDSYGGISVSSLSQKSAIPKNLNSRKDENLMMGNHFLKINSELLTTCYSIFWIALSMGHTHSLYEFLQTPIRLLRTLSNAYTFKNSKVHNKWCGSAPSGFVIFDQIMAVTWGPTPKWGLYELTLMLWATVISEWAVQGMMGDLWIYEE